MKPNIPVEDLDSIRILSISLTTIFSRIKVESIMILIPLAQSEEKKAKT